jgi:Dyp-type peroxidase family
VTELRKIVCARAAGFHEELGHVLRVKPGSPDAYPIEPFGFRDNISQPAFYESDRERQLRGKRALEHWDAAAPLGVALCPDPYGRSPYACGSYFVLRKLEQDVEQFYSKTDELALAHGLAPERLRERLIGRQLDGTPLDRGAIGLDDFDFGGDQRGEVCPFFAHIRKNNPRSDLWPNRRAPVIAAGSRRISRPEDDRRIVRRGMSYGPAIVRSTLGVPALDEAGHVRLEPGQNPGSIGLLFLCAQSNIERQFEHLQICWANKQDHPRGKPSAVDPVSGQLAPGETNRIPLRVTSGHPPAQSEAAKLPNTQVAPDEANGMGPDGAAPDVAPFVKFRGGDYFFAPSISFLRGLLDELLS